MSKPTPCECLWSASFCECAKAIAEGDAAEQRLLHRPYRYSASIIALLTDAVFARQKEIAWLTRMDCGPTSFIWLCSLLNFDADRMRKRLLQREFNRVRRGDYEPGKQDSFAP